MLTAAVEAAPLPPGKLSTPAKRGTHTPEHGATPTATPHPDHDHWNHSVCRDERERLQGFVGAVRVLIGARGENNRG